MTQQVTEHLKGNSCGAELTESWLVGERGASSRNRGLRFVGLIPWVTSMWLQHNPI